MPGAPPVKLPFIDVRNVAEAHFNALKLPVNGQRYAGNQGTVNFQEIARIISQNFDKYGYNTGKKKFTRCQLKLGACLGNK